MSSIPKEEKNFNSKGTRSQVKSILKTLIKLNKDKTSSEIKDILVSQVKSLIIKMLKLNNRLLKIYWAIDTKNTNYKQSGGVEEYSASDIYNMVITLLINDGYKKVCKRTIERDIKLLNEMGLVKSKIRRFGKEKGSISHYRQNMKLVHIHKDIIWNYLIHLLQESLSDKKIIGDFDDASEDENFDYTNLEKFGILPNFNEHNNITPMSHVCESDVFKANISNINNKNSKEVLFKKTDSSNKKIKQYKFEKKDVETRLVLTHKISKEYLKQVKQCSNTDATYINALINLEVAIIEYKNEYNIEDILEHFIKQFSNRYRHKVWMMMKRSDDVISDYELIWEGRFRDWYPNKYKLGYVVKESYGGDIRVKNRNLNFGCGKIEEKISNHSGYEEIKRIDKEKQEKRKLELKQREEYLKKLFEREAQEMQERLRKAKEEQEYLREQTKKDMITIVEKGSTTSDNIVSDSNLIGFNRGLNVENNNNLLDYQPMSEGFCKPSGPAVACSKTSLKVNYAEFKTTKGLGISLDSLGINMSSSQKRVQLMQKKR